jgi:phage terminase large subunit-like protein
MALIDAWRKARPKNYTDSWHFDEMFKVLDLSYEHRAWVLLEKACRHGGSEVFNIHGPAARLTVAPQETFQLTTSTQNLSDKFSSSALAIVQRSGLPFKFKETGRAQWKIDTAGLGENDATYFASGIDGTRQGRGCSVAIVDDIYKTGFQARQQGIREKYQDTIQNSVINRLTPSGVCHFLGARIHPTDIQGWVLEMEREEQIEPLLHLRLPATNDGGKDAWFRHGDDIEYFPAYSALWEGRYSREKLDNIRSAVSEAWWQSQYQQSPMLAAVPYFNIENAPRYEHPRVIRTWTAWDLAQYANVKGSFSAGAALGQTADGRLMLLHAIRGRWTQEQMEQQIYNQFHEIARMTGVKPHAVIVERAAAGFSILEKLDGILPMEPASPHGTDKEGRAGAVCSIVNRGLCALPKEGTYPWQVWAEEDLRCYPMVKSSDFIDSFVYGLAWSSMPGFFNPPKETTQIGYDAYPSSQREHKASFLLDGDESPELPPGVSDVVW